MPTERQQINVRLDAETAARIDQKRIELSATIGQIPTRSDVLRMALEEFLGSVKPTKQPPRKIK